MNANSTTKLANPQGSNTETKHTPTPWHLHGTEVYSPDGRICDCGGHYPYWDNPKDKTNATFIVRACNEHAALCAVAHKANLLGVSPHSSELTELREALASLAAIRKG